MASMRIRMFKYIRALTGFTILIALLMTPVLKVSAAVTVYTYAATKITGDSAQLNGRLDDLGGQTNFYAWFDWGTSLEYGNSTDRKYFASADNLSYTLDDLEPYTTYHYRIGVVQVALLGQPDKIIYGNNQSFTTTAQQTKGFAFHAVPAVNVYDNRATLVARVLNLGKYTSVMVWFEWGTTAQYGRTTAIRRMGEALPFQSEIAGLSPGVVYHWRAVLQSTLATAPKIVSPDMTLKTLNSGLTSPTVTLLPASDLTQNSATLTAEIHTPANFEGSKAWFEWGTLPAFKEAVPAVAVQDSGKLKINIGGLNPKTTYSFRAGLVAENGRNEVYYSDNLSFTTGSGDTFNGLSRMASSITSSTATLNGIVMGTQGDPVPTVWFEYDDGLGFSNTTTLEKVDGGGPVMVNIEGLKPATKYYFRMVTLKSGVLGLSEGLAFTTLASNRPVVRTMGAAYQSDNVVVFRGELQLPSISGTAKVWFEYGNNSEFGNLSPVQERAAEGGFTISVSGYGHNENINFRASALIDGQYYHGQIMTVRRNELLPALPDKMNVVDADGKAAVVSTPSSWKVTEKLLAWLEWGPTPSYGYYSQPTILEVGDSFKTSVTGLNQNTFYHYRMVVIAGRTVIKGTDQLFTSGRLRSLNLETMNAESITDTTAVLKGRFPTGSRGWVVTWFDWGLTSVFSNSAIGVSRTDGEVSIRLTGLRRNTQYFYRLVAASGTELVAGYVVSFKTASTSPPEGNILVETTSPVEVMAQSCTLTGRVDSLGGKPRLDLWFEYGTDEALGNRTENQTAFSPGIYKQGIKGLTPGTQYYYRMVTTFDNNPIGKMEAQLVNFKTPLPSSPTFLISTLPVMRMTSDSAYLRGSVDYLWGYASLQYWFEWGGTMQYGNRSPVLTVGATGVLETHLTGLLPGATYHYRLVAQGPDGMTRYGTDSVFKTGFGKIFSVTTGAASDIRSDSALLAGQVISMGTYQALRIYFEWGETKNYGQRTSEQVIGSAQNLSVRLNGLQKGAVYHYRLVAEALGDVQATAIGEDRTFQTLIQSSQPGLFGCQGPR